MCKAFSFLVFSLLMFSPLMAKADPNWGEAVMVVVTGVGIISFTVLIGIFFTIRCYKKKNPQKSDYIVAIAFNFLAFGFSLALTYIFLLGKLLVAITLVCFLLLYLKHKQQKDK